MKTFPFALIICIFFILFSSHSQLHSQTLFIKKLNDLDFGDVFIGYNAVTLDTDSGAAKFSFYHSDRKWKNVNINFNLPTTLTNGIDIINIIFDRNYTSYSLTDQNSGRTYFNPFQRLKIKKLDPFQTAYIWLGGTINTTIGLSDGLYTGTIILTVSY